jgi:exopolyphosphatase/guanosine-5'-triphosphate,3'-diphosphate pyrophosphatase
VAVRIGVVDVGSNTIRLLVAEVDEGIVVPLEKERVRLALGEEIERSGGVSDTSIATAAKSVRKLCLIARRHRVDSLDVFLTAPGRQSDNAAVLVAALGRAAEHPVRVLSTDEEGRLAYGGAVATADVELPGRIAVCDVGGASTEIAVGAPSHAPDWVASVDIGSVRLSVRAEDLEHARVEASEALGALAPPQAELALAVGGSARAARRLVGPWLGDAELTEALRLVETLDPRAISKRFGVDRSRARILPAGIAILAQVHEVLGVPLHVCDGGIREGAVLATLDKLAA